MLSPDETYRIQLKAIEQAMHAAGVVESEPLLRVLNENTWVATWTRPSEIIGQHCFEYACGLTDHDYRFLKINKISPA